MRLHMMYRELRPQLSAVYPFVRWTRERRSGTATRSRNTPPYHLPRANWHHILEHGPQRWKGRCIARYDIPPHLALASAYFPHVDHVFRSKAITWSDLWGSMVSVDADHPGMDLEVLTLLGRDQLELGLSPVPAG